MKAKKKKKVYKCCGKKYEKYHHFLRHRRKRHPEKVAKAKHAAQMSNYGQSAEEFHATLKLQNNRCAICKHEATNISLSQDHTHFIAKLKVSVYKNGEYWIATCVEMGLAWRSKSKKKAKRMVVLKLKRASRRGILCWHCNSALRKFLDNADLLIAAGEYLKKWQRKQHWKFVDHVDKRDKVARTYKHGAIIWVK